MKSRIWMRRVVVCLALAGAISAGAATYYINDDYTPGADIYTTLGGNDANDGLTPGTPKRTLANLIATTPLLPGDVVLIDTGTYPSGTIISNTVAGVAGNPIVFQGSTNLTAGGTVFTGSGNVLTVSGSHLHVRDFKLLGGSQGLFMSGANYCDFLRIQAISNAAVAIQNSGSFSNALRQVVAMGGGPTFSRFGGGGANYIEYSVLLPVNAIGMPVAAPFFSNVVGCVIGGNQAFLGAAYTPLAGSHNVFWGMNELAVDMQTLADLQRALPGWRGNTVADPLFVHSAGLDYHVTSPAGFVSNGVWVTNSSVAYSPLIDFGPPSSTAWTNEPAPNGARVNTGLFGGTPEASKSRTTDWVYALSFNDGGNLIQTGRLEWVGGNLGAGATVDLQFSTNNGTAWSTIQAGVPATNETYTWVPAFAHPAVRWRVVNSTNPACVSTNARLFSVRPQGTNAFVFYVNDASTANDVYGMGLGNPANLGIAPSLPKRSLQGILSTYDLEGGDTVYVDTGDYTTNVTMSLTAFDSGSAGNPVRVIGSPKGSVFNRGNTAADTFELIGASFVELEHLTLTGGRYGLYGNNTADIVVRQSVFRDNRYGVFLAGSASRHVFENCGSMNNTDNAFYGISSTSRSNHWLNGVMWGSPSLIRARATSLSVSNSILGGGTALFQQEVVPGNHNLVWDTQVGLTYPTFSALQASGLGWDRSLYANPQFANPTGGDYHLKSVMGRYNPATGLFVTNDVVHSPGIDFGNPASTAYTNEPTPNGSRLNVGLHGGTAQASKSRTNAWLQAMSYMDGGTLDAQAGAWLHWTGGEYDPGSFVTLWLSRDGGASWEPLATNVPAADGQYFYQNTATNDPSSLFAQWKVTLEDASPDVGSQTPTNFTYKNGVFEFFVNDGSLAGDVYSTATGSDTNLGVSAGSPMASLAALVDRYQLGPGDRVYVDTGSYTFTNAVLFTSLDSGTPGEPIRIIGSTNRVAGGSTFGSSGPSPTPLGFDFRSGASNLVVQDIVFTNHLRGVSVANSAGIQLDGVEVRQARDRGFDLQANAQNIELRGCVAHGGGIGAYLQQATNVTIRNSVFWQNQTNAIYVGSQVGLLVENSILASTRTNAALFSIASLAGFTSDYNGLHAGAFTRVGINRGSGAVADNLSAWQALSAGRDLWSIPGDPQLADPDQYDYHLKTEETLGRRLPNGQRTSDPVSSPLLDAGNPLSDVSEEPMPNGGRMNIGRFGGTDEASIAPTIPWIRAVSFGDAGSVTDSVVSLVWTAGNFTNETARIEVSVDGGKTWGTTVATGVPVTNRAASWTVAGLPDTPAGVWRVVNEGNTNLWARSTNFFAIRNSALDIFVATADTNESMYATGPGASDNWMASAEAPINSLRTVFERFDLEPGDRIWVDTGTYSESAPIVVGMKNSGTTSQPVRVTGNTALPYRGTILARASRTVGANGMQISRAGGLRLSALTISNAWSGIQVDNTQGVEMDRVRVTHCVTNAIYAGPASRLDLSRIRFEHSLFGGLNAQTGSVVKVQHSLFRQIDRANLYIRGGDVELKNSVLEAAGNLRNIYFWGGGGKLTSDFNNIRATEGANVAGGDGRQPDRFLIDWQISTAFSNDVSSFGYAAQFADPEGMDFHLKSEYGRYNPATGFFVTNDATTSVLIDLGDPASTAYTNEPADNGGRVNVGLYGGTAEASKSSGMGALVPLTGSDGGTLRGDVKLYWAWNGFAGNEIVNVEFSADGGATWTNIATNIYVDVGTAGLTWPTTNFLSTAMGVWRVVTTNDPPVVGQTETLFAIKNEPLSYYVNDGSTVGDVYCSAPGHSTHSGLAPDSPLDSLATLFSRYKIEHGDTVYVDTGVYARNSVLAMAVPSVGATNRLVIQGSTNEVEGGTVFTNSGSGAVIELQNTRNMDLRDLRLHGGDRGLSFAQSSSNRAVRVRSVGARAAAFDLSTQSDQNQFIQCAALHFFGTGVHVAVSTTQTTPTTNYWGNGVLASVPASNGIAVATGTLVGVQSGRLYISNSVLAAYGPAHSVYTPAQGAVQGDYNCYHREFTNSVFATVSLSNPSFGIRTMLLGHLQAWMDWNGTDTNSFAADPLLADVAAGDLHPRSAGGRYDPATGTFVEDAETSPLIDAGPTTMDWSLETEPNGGRANIGLYGGTAHASRTPADGTFVLLTHNQGGVVRGSQTLRWIARGAATNAAVNIFLSTNSGANWQLIGVNLSSTAGQQVWNSATNASTPIARWRVASALVPAWVATSERDFLIHNSNLTYYVNDASISNDMYCSAPGAPDNTGLSPASPMDSLADLLARYDLEPGDEVRVDTGEYFHPSPVTVGYLDSGVATNPVVVQGSTQHPGTAFQGAGIRVDNARGVVVRDLLFRSQTTPFPAAGIEFSEDIELSRVDILGGADGVNINSSSNIWVRNFSVAGVLTNGVANRGSFNTRLEFGTIWSNGVAQVLANNRIASGNIFTTSYVTVSNCILGAFGVRKPVYEVRGQIFANYNNLHLAGGALAALSFESGFGREYDSVGKWASDSGQDLRSLSHNPRFAETLLGDFHLRSSAGRYDPSTGAYVLDLAADNSPLIDAGDLAIACVEPEPNGGRVNLGRYGNTDQASKTPTNGTLTLISFNDGGRAVGTNVAVYWLARGEATNGTVSISYSADGGVTWTNLASGIPALAGQWTWDSTLVDQTVQGVLRIEGTDGSTAQNAQFFSVRNQPFFFYINDNSTTNDVYCSAVGNNANSGLAPDQPMADLNALLAKYDLEGGDIVYIDTGVYRGLDPWRITQADSAGSLEVPPVVFQGSTYGLLDGTVLDRSFNSIGIQVDYAVGVQLRNITISNTVGSALVLNDSYGVDAEWIAVGAGNLGFRLNSGSQLRIANSLVFNAQRGVLVENRNILLTNMVNPVVEHCVFWEMQGAAIQLAGLDQVVARHNILSVAPGFYVYELGGSSVLDSDYNSIWIPDGARVFRRTLASSISPVSVIYETVGAWAAESGQDLHSYDGDPLLVDPASRNFHLRSREGRWVPRPGVWTNDLVSSPLIDAGHPSATGWTNEPAPNGSRVNIGLFGGSDLASKSSTNSALHLLSLNRGGVASGQVALNWKASGLAAGHTVRLEVSVDNGASWSRVAEGIAASLGGVVWNSLSLPSSPLALWRVQDEVEAGVEAVSELNFVLHNGPIYYYVNDEFTNGLVYCSQPGDSSNTGVSPDSPKRWVSEVLETYNLEPGDVIYVDTGVYQTAQPTVIGELDSGDISQDPSRQVTIQGSTNRMEGGSVFILSDPESDALVLDGAYGIRLRDLQIRSARRGLSVQNGFYVAADNLDIRNCVNGAYIQSSSNVVFTRLASVANQNAGIHFYGANGEAMHMGSSVLWSNTYGIYLEQGYVNASNSIIGIVAPHAFGYYMQADRGRTGIQGNYNNLFVGHATGAAGALQTGSAASARTSVYASVSAWSSATGQERNSLAHDPLLADPANDDFHLKSAGGRYVPGSGWVYDVVSSPLIDAGQPSSMAWTAEPDPNGRRLNIGLYGGSPEASKTPLDGWLTLVSLNDGGTASGLVNLTWTVGGAATNYTLCIEYSPDNGDSWTNVVCGWPASTGSYLWDSVPYGSSSLGRWRALCVEDVSISAMNLAPFTLRNPPYAIPYYVNDSSTDGDVYCTAPGDDANNGLTPATPKASLQAVLDTYALAPEDVVYVDAGTYVAGAPPIKLDQTVSGFVQNGTNYYVTVQGSTNPAAATVFVAPSFSTPYVFSLEYAVNVRLRSLTIRNASVGVNVNQSIGCIFDNVRIENNRAIGLNLTQSENIQVVRSVLWKNTSPTGGVAVVLGQSSLFVENSVLWGHPTAIFVGNGTLRVTNSVLDATGADGRIFFFSQSANASSGFRGDYNAYYRRNGALVAEQQTITGGSDYYNDVPTWAAAVASEQHTMSMDPLFADEVGGDFHPKSTQGRYTPSGWVQDAVLSPLIDAGHPAWPSTNEPSPNGGIINLGAYGNTRQASMTQTNPPWLRVVSYNEGGVITSNTLLYWLHGGMPSNTPVRLEFSTDYEVSWQTIASNLPAGSRQYFWDVSAMPLTLALNWRVVVQSNTNVWDSSELPVSVKTKTYDYYVNDGSITNDVWCTGPGLAWDPYVSYGTNPATPLNSLYALLTHYPVGAGDRIFIDTGTYGVSTTNRVLLDGNNMGSAAFPLRIYGSTNVLAGGTLLSGDGSVSGIRLQNTRHVEIHNLRIQQAQQGIAMENTDTVLLSGIESFNNTSNGIWMSGSANVEIRNSRLWRNVRYGLSSTGHKGSQNLLSSTLWGNRLGAVANTLGQLRVSNSILVVTSAVPIYAESGSGTMAGDYNMFGLAAGSLLATNSQERVAYANLRQWQAKDRDIRSFLAPPLFVNPQQGDLHLQSRAGFWSNGTWATSTQTSWAVDAGDPLLLAYTNEPTPHGSRINAGAYGGTPQASKSDSSVPELRPASLWDGGVAVNGQPLYWLYRGIHPTNTVRIEYSPDNGASWVLVDNGLLVGSAPYFWFSSVDPTPEALWRVILESDTNVVGQTSVPFTLRTRPLVYYVNDAVSDGTDVYTTAPGAATNRGYTADSPLDSIQAVLAKYQLAGGDEIRVDTGTYVLSNSVFVSLLNSGDATNRVRIVGSTNVVAGGSLFVPAVGMLDPAFLLFGASHVEVSRMRTEGFVTGVAMDEGANQCIVSDWDIVGSSRSGVSLNKGQNVRLQRVLIRDGLTNGLSATASLFSMEGCVVWSNRHSALLLGSGAQAEITNTVLEATGLGKFCYDMPATGAVVRANHNNLYISGGAQIGFVSGLQYQKLPQWVKGTAQDRNSLSTDPLFHDPANGDFHLRSAAGRYQHGVGWVQDAADPELPDFSPLIDMGSPRTAWSNEPAPNGGRRNIGLYGNTAEASKSNTNRWLQVVTAMSGGLMSGGINLTWGAGSAIASNELVRLEYSYGNGEDPWIRIGEAAAGSGQFFWQSDLKQTGVELWLTSPAGRWRIYLLSDTNITDMTDTYFGLRNSPFKYYLNDDSTVDDVYTDVPGHDDHWGFFPWAPKLTLQALLEAIDLEPTDEVYIDTGLYYMTDTNLPIVWEASNGGEAGGPVVVQGSTHASGSWFITTNRFVTPYFFYMGASHVDMRDLRFRGENMEFRGDGLAVQRLVLTNGAMRLLGNSSQFEDVQLDRGTLSLSGQSNRVERLQQRWGETEMVGTNVSLLHSVVYTTNNARTGLVVNAVGAVVSNSTIVSTRGTALGKRGFGTMRLGHSILVAGGSESNSVVSWEDGGLLSDWNNLLARDSAWIGNRQGRWEKLAYWQAISGQDANSVSFEPLFQNEAHGDVHLNSEVGRWSPIFNGWDVDGVHSPLIDLGNPWIGTKDEPMPNGYRRNLGAYGGTAQASKSRETFWLTALTMNDGGVLKGTNVVLRWAAGNASEKTVTLQYFNGTDWVDIATGLSAAQGSYVWNTTGFPDSFNALWRVVAEDGSGVVDAIDTTFALRNNPQDFFVNDGYDPDADIYTTAAGNAGNDGLTPATPKASLQAVLDAYDLEGGDTVFVDSGSYPASADIRIIWSRSGSVGNPVVIQGNTNGIYTVLTRTGSTNFPAVGINVKASDIELRHLAIQGMDRGILLESNRNVAVEGVAVMQANTGIAVEAAHGTRIRNSALWRTMLGIQLSNTRTSVLENLTFALPAQAGIQLFNTVVDTLQNNIFIPAAGGYAYSIGSATSLLANATMDYNVYDFSQPDSGFFPGATNTLRGWQLALNRDFRSAITNAGLVEVDVPGDLHPKSEYGRWTNSPTGGGWVLDPEGETSWAVDHGNPNGDYSQEPEDNGGRLNIGRYGNTVQASKGSAEAFYELRSVNEPQLLINQNDQIWPLVWSAHLIDELEMVLVQISGDGGLTWTTLTNTSAYTEYYVWQASVQFQTLEGRWRVIGVNNTNILAESEYDFTVRYRDLGIRSRPYPVSGLIRFEWEGGVQGRRYRIEYSDDFGQTWNAWQEKYNGPAQINKSNFAIAAGESQLSYTFEDRTSYLHRQRWYRIWEIRE
jgi:hypothetical protein